MGKDRVTALVRGRRLSRAKKIFSYDGRIDVLIWNSEAIVLNSNVLESLLRDPAVLDAELTDAVGAFEGSGLFAGLDALAAVARSDSNFARGMRRVFKAGYLKQIDVDGIRDSITEWGHDEILVTPDDRLLFEPASRWSFLRVLDDGYLTSDLTGLRYEVNSKRRWNRIRVLAAERDDMGRLVRLHGPGIWSPRAIADVASDIERGRRQYFVALEGLMRRIGLRDTPDGAVPWAGTDESDHNLLLDLPSPD